MQGDRSLLVDQAALTATASQQSEFLSVPKAARRLGVSPATLYRMVDAGQFPAMRMRGSIKILAEVVDAIRAELRAGRTVDVAKWAAAMQAAASGRAGGFSTEGER